jgi:hypothetical protein
MWTAGQGQPDEGAQGQVAQASIRQGLWGHTWDTQSKRDTMKSDTGRWWC